MRGVEQLGQVRLAILETNGQISVYFFEDDKVKPGLLILPSDCTCLLYTSTLAGILPLLFTRVLNQQTENHDSTSITSMLKLRQARLGVNGCIISGIVLGSLYGLMPLYLNHKGVSNASIGFWKMCIRDRCVHQFVLLGSHPALRVFRSGCSESCYVMHW